MSKEHNQIGAQDFLSPLQLPDPLPAFVRADGASYFTEDGKDRKSVV